MFGGCKNFLGNSKTCDHNVIVHPGIPSRATGGRRCQTDDNNLFSHQYHHDNQCVTQDGDFYSWKCSDPLNRTVYETWNNRLYSPNKTFSLCHKYDSLKSWQAAGQDANSVMEPMPSVTDIVAMGKLVLS